MRQLYLDMDGVLSDFDTGYEKAFGVKTSKEIDNVDWDMVRAHDGGAEFFLNLPLMPDAMELWNFARRFNPIILTGAPAPRKCLVHAPCNKIAWAKKNLGADVQIITTESKTKSYFCRPGDVLVDDWEKYKDLWIAKRGVWVTHRSAEDTIDTLTWVMDGFDPSPYKGHRRKMSWEYEEQDARTRRKNGLEA